MRGRFINVGAEGLRRVPGQGAWPPDTESINVFVFGGSTTFGVGAPDDQTIPSYLAVRLARLACGAPIRVYNLGRPAYYSAQERILFEQLVLAGRVPRLAVFVDGLNEFYIWPRPLSADVMRAALDGTFEPGVARRTLDLLESLPLVRSSRALRARFAAERAGTPDPDVPDPETVLAEWAANRQLIERVAQAYGVATLFVWQPVPDYRYEARHHLFPGDAGLAWRSPARMRRGYELMEARREQLGDNFVWLADLQEGWRENLYVTDMHYRPVLSEAIADRIARAVDERSLLDCTARTVSRECARRSPASDLPSSPPRPASYTWSSSVPACRCFPSPRAPTACSWTRDCGS